MDEKAEPSVWYVATIAAFVYIIVSLYEAGVPGSDVPFIILTD